MLNNKWIFKTFLIGAAASIASCSSTNESKVKSVEEKPIAVTVSAPSNHTGRSLSLSGRVEAVQSANITTRIMGYITKVLVKTGEKVEKGQLLFSVNNADFLAKKAQADAAVAQAEAVYNSAQKDFERYTILFKQQSASAKELDNITLQYKSAKAALDAAKQMRNEVNAQLSYTDVTAPFNGVVTQKFLDAGNMATPGMPVLSIETNGTLQVTASVPETEISHIKLGTDASLTVKAAGSTFNGKVTEISNSSQNSGGLYVIKINVPDNDKKDLLAGMYVNVIISIADTLSTVGKGEGILVPESSIVHKGELDGIYSISSENQALLRWVRLGKRINGEVEILSGLGKSEKFILHADGNLYNGAPVKIAE